MELQNETTAPVEEAKEKSSKIEKAFVEAMTKLAAVMGDKEKIPKKKPKVANDRIAALIDEMLKERAEGLEKSFKSKAMLFLESVIKFNQESENALVLYNKTVEEKKQALTKEANELFKEIESIDKLKQDYIKGLTASTEA